MTSSTRTSISRRRSGCPTPCRRSACSRCPSWPPSARTAPVARQLAALAEWVGKDGREVDEAGDLTPEGLTEATAALGVDADELAFLWEYALGVEWLVFDDDDEDRVVPGRDRRRLGVRRRRAGVRRVVRDPRRPCSARRLSSTAPTWTRKTTTRTSSSSTSPARGWRSPSCSSSPAGRASPSRSSPRCSGRTPPAGTTRTTKRRTTRSPRPAPSGSRTTATPPGCCSTSSRTPSRSPRTTS